jgi:putative transcriptional regulator
MAKIARKYKPGIELNRLRIVLAEQNQTNKWLADKLGVTEGTVSKWVNNVHQPSLETLYDISIIFNIALHDLIQAHGPKK